jgi:hypothetical protein
MLEFNKGPTKGESYRLILPENSHDAFINSFAEHGSGNSKTPNILSIITNLGDTYDVS